MNEYEQRYVHDRPTDEKFLGQFSEYDLHGRSLCGGLTGRLIIRRGNYREDGARLIEVTLKRSAGIYPWKLASVTPLLGTNQLTSAAKNKLVADALEAANYLLDLTHEPGTVRMGDALDRLEE